MTGKLTLAQLAAMTAQQLDPNIPEVTKRLNRAQAEQELSSDELQIARLTLQDTVVFLATMRAGQAEARNRADGPAASAAEVYAAMGHAPDRIALLNAEADRARDWNDTMNARRFTR